MCRQGRLEGRDLRVGRSLLLFAVVSMSSAPSLLQLTTQLSQARPKLVPLFQHSLSFLFNECIKFDREVRHALSQVLEVEVHRG